jgi:hypothetical protein
VRHRTIRSKGCLSNRTALAMVFKLLEGAQKSWRRLDGHNQLPKLVLGVTFNDGIEVIAKPTDRQPATAAAWPARPSPKIGDSSIGDAPLLWIKWCTFSTVTGWMRLTTGLKSWVNTPVGRLIRLVTETLPRRSVALAGQLAAAVVTVTETWESA